MKQLKKFYLVLIFLTSASTSYTQMLFNSLQMDSVYVNKKVKNIYVYHYSMKNLRALIEFDKSGKKLKSSKYDNTYRKKSKRIRNPNSVTYYHYDGDLLVGTSSDKNLISSKYFYSEEGKIISKEFFDTGVEKHTNTYSYDPLKITSIVFRDSIIADHQTMTFDREFYTKNIYGYFINPKYRQDSIYVNGKLQIKSVFEENVRVEIESSRTNTFNEKNQLIESNVISTTTSIGLEDMISNNEYIYEYYENDLLKVIISDKGSWFYEYDYYK